MIPNIINEMMHEDKSPKPKHHKQKNKKKNDFVSVFQNLITPTNEKNNPKKNSKHTISGNKNTQGCDHLTNQSQKNMSHLKESDKSKKQSFSQTLSKNLDQDQKEQLITPNTAQATLPKKNIRNILNTLKSPKHVAQQTKKGKIQDNKAHASNLQSPATQDQVTADQLNQNQTKNKDISNKRGRISENKEINKSDETAFKAPQNKENTQPVAKNTDTKHSQHTLSKKENPSEKKDNRNNDDKSVQQAASTEVVPAKVPQSTFELTPSLQFKHAHSISHLLFEHITQGKKQFTLNLHPEKLGAINIRISTEGTTTVELTSKDPHVQDLLQHELPILSKHLKMSLPKFALKLSVKTSQEESEKIKREKSGQKNNQQKKD